MGLDIKAYSHTKPCLDHATEGATPNYDAADEAGHVVVYNNADFPGRFEGLTSRCQIPTHQSQSFRFHAGSYGGYNSWRRILSLRMLEVDPETVWSNFERFHGQPFAELIHFADNEGTIGPVVSKKLAADFQRHADRARETHDTAAPDSAWWIDRYECWLIAFTLASHGGFVDFR